MKKIFIIAAIYSSFVYAGDRKGNGADSVVCSNKTYLLDFLEINTIEKYELNNESQSDELTQVKEALLKIPLLSGRLQTYFKWIDEFYSEVRFVKTGIGEVSDSGNINIDRERYKNCSFKQLVLQRREVIGAEKRYLIDQNLWNQLSNTHKAGVILHELLYRELNSETSFNLRHLNRFIFDHYLTNREINYDLLLSIFKANKFSYVNIHEMPFTLDSVFIRENLPIGQIIYPGEEILILENKVKSSGGFVEFFTNGFPKFFYYTGYMRLNSPEYKIHVCGNAPKNSCRVNFYPSGAIFSLNNISIENQTGPQKIEYKDAIFFNENGEIIEIR